MERRNSRVTVTGATTSGQGGNYAVDSRVLR